MFRLLAFALVFVSTLATAAPPAGEATTYLGKDKDAPLEVTVTGAAAEAMFERLKDVKQTDDWEDGLIPTVYRERRGKNLVCLRSTVVGPGSEWNHTCRFSLDGAGNAQPVH